MERIGRLTALQSRLVRLLAGFTPRWTLTGGGALVGVYTKHRDTRDLDLFWHGLDALEQIPANVCERIRAVGLRADVVQTAPAFSRVRVDDETETVIVDLVADPTPCLEAPREVNLGGCQFVLEAPHELLVNKLGALLGRSELRDLDDVRALVAAGGDLPRAIADAPKKDGGFSPLVLAWLLQQFPLQRLAAASGWDNDRLDALERFRAEFVEKLMALAKPDQ